MVNLVSIRRYILRCNGENLGQLPGSNLHNVQQILRNSQDIPLLYRWRDSKAPCIDNPVPLGGVHRENRVQLWGNLLSVDLGHIHRRTHKRHRLMGRGRGIGADMGGYKNIPLQKIPLVLHIQQLCRQGNSRQRSVPVGDKAHPLRPCPDSTQPSQQADGRRVSSPGFPAGAGNPHLYHVGGLPRFLSGPRQRICPGVRLRVDGL